jgi:excisionase family DNA binding protein
MDLDLRGYPPVLSAGQIADATGFNQNTILRWMKEGRLGRVVLTPGGHRRVPRESLAAVFAGLGWDVTL